MKNKNFKWNIEDVEKLFSKRDFKGLNKQCDDGFTSFHTAVVFDFELAYELVKCPEIDINKKNSNEETALITCCRFFNEKMFKNLLDRKDLKINSQNDMGNTALHLASQRSPSFIPLLMTHPDIDLTIKNIVNKTALEFACDTHPDNALIFRANYEQLKLKKGSQVKVKLNQSKKGKIL